MEMASRQVVLRVLESIADRYIDSGYSQIVFSKAEFIREYKWLLRQKRIDFIKMETLLRTLRKMAEESIIISYVDGRGGKYVLDILRL